MPESACSPAQVDLRRIHDCSLLFAKAFRRGSARTHRLRSPVHACVYLPVPSIVPSDIQLFGGVPIATLEEASSAGHTPLAARLVEALLLIHRLLITEPTRIFCVPAC